MNANTTANINTKNTNGDATVGMNNDVNIGMNEKELRCKALYLLSRREHTRQEINSKLKTKAENSAVLGAVLDALESEHLQSDERFAENYVRMRANRGFGPARIRQELREKGVSVEEVAAFLKDPKYDWGELAAIARHKKFGKQKASDANEHSKQMRFLLYRGFNNEQIKVALVRG